MSASQSPKAVFADGRTVSQSPQVPLEALVAIPIVLVVAVLAVVYFRRR